jgi:hypothetical protein
MSQKTQHIEITKMHRLILLIYAFETGILAFALLIFAEEISQLLGMDSMMTIRLIGVASILPFIAGYWAAMQRKCPKFLFLFLAMLGEIWVLGSILLFFFVPLTMIGKIAVILVAAMIAGVGGFLFYLYVRG